VRVRTDANQLETALLNLAINGRDAMPEGGTLTISITEQSVQGDHSTNLPLGKFACLSVSDTGHGMDEGHAGPCDRALLHDQGIGKGTGLGLSMVDGLIAQSGGKLMVHSTVGRGTTIELWLPLATDCIAKAVERDASEAGESAPTKRQLCVLAVDDDSLVLANVAAMLEI